jgi:hypothetical protein
MLPSAIIFINGDIDGYGQMYGNLNAIGKATIESQLYIEETITSEEFNNRILVDPNYPTIVHLMNYRILVMKPDLRDYTNYEYADIVLFVKHGLVSVMKNNYLQPGLTVPINKLEIHQLLRYNNSPNVVILPQAPGYPSILGGIFALESADTSGVHSANIDNEAHNTDFINRK